MSRDRQVGIPGRLRWSRTTSRKGTGVVALLMGLVGFGLGLFFGWILHRERVGGDAPTSDTRTTDLATTQLAETSSRLEDADRDIVGLRTQLTDAQHLLDERAATITELEQELARHREEGADRERSEPEDAPSADRVAAVAVDDEPAAQADSAGPDVADVEPTEDVGVSAAAPADHVDVEVVKADDVEAPADHVVDAAADEATTPDIATQVTAEDLELDDTDVTEEVALVAPAADDAGEPDVDQTQSFAVDETEAIPALRPNEPSDVDETQALAVDETEAIDVATLGEHADMDETQSFATDETEAIPVVSGDTTADESADETQRIEVDQTEAVGIVAEEAPVAPAADLEPTAPVETPAESEPDDLRRIRGIGPAMQRQLNAQGITTFRDLAELDDDARLQALQAELPGVAGRVRRGRWVEQARDLVSESSAATS